MSPVWRTRGAAGAATAGALAAAMLLAACGQRGDRPVPTPESGVRAAASGYLDALAAQDFPRACGLMTATARRDLTDATGTTCPQALRAGAGEGAEDLAGARREVAGADVDIHGTRATIGPLGPAQQPLRLARERGRWLVAG